MYYDAANNVQASIFFSASTSFELESFIRRLMDRDELLEAETAFYKDDGIEYRYDFVMCLLEHCTALDEYSLEKNKGRKINGNS